MRPKKIAADVICVILLFTVLHFAKTLRSKKHSDNERIIPSNFLNENVTTQQNNNRVYIHRNYPIYRDTK